MGDGTTDIVTTGAGDTVVITFDIVVSMRLEVDISTLVILDIDATIDAMSGNG